MYGFKFLYKAAFDNGLIEHELDHVFFGFSNESLALILKFAIINNLGREKLQKLITKNPTHFSPWFKLCYQKSF